MSKKIFLLTIFVSTLFANLSIDNLKIKNEIKTIKKQLKSYYNVNGGYPYSPDPLLIFDTVWNNQVIQDDLATKYVYQSLNTEKFNQEEYTTQGYVLIQTNKILQEKDINKEIINVFKNECENGYENVKIGNNIINKLSKDNTVCLLFSQTKLHYQEEF